MAAYKDLVGQKITKVTSNPSEPKTGQMWYNSTDGKLRGLGVVEAWRSSASMITARAAHLIGEVQSPPLSICWPATRRATVPAKAPVAKPNPISVAEK